jgi:hypothetical protein
LGRPAALAYALTSESAAMGEKKGAKLAPLRY